MAGKTAVKAKQSKGKAKAKPAPKRASNGKAKPAKGHRADDVALADPTLFDPLTPGEVADALRTLIEDRRLSSMATGNPRMPPASRSR